MIPEFKLKITIPQYKTSTKDHKKSCDYICARQKCQWAFVNSITFSLLGLDQVIKVSLLKKLNKIERGYYPEGIAFKHDTSFGEQRKFPQA